jgi:hypothetical protein
VAILLRDSTTVGAGDDTVTALWDRRFDHVAYVAVDSFVLGDHEEASEAVDAQRREVVADVLSRSRIDKDWSDDSLEARAMQRNLSAAMWEAAGSASALALDAATRTTLAALVTRSLEDVEGRHLQAVLDAFVEAARGRDERRLLEAFADWTADQVTLRRYAPAVELLGAVRAGLAQRLGEERAAGLAAAVGRAMFPAAVVGRMLAQMLDEARAAKEARRVDAGSGDGAAAGREAAAALRAALGLVEDASLVEAAVAALSAAGADGLREGLLDYLARWMPSCEAPLGELLRAADPDLSARVLDVMTLGASEEALAAALGHAMANPAAEVRVEALRRLTPSLATPLGGQIAALLDDPEAAVRTELLRVVSEQQLRDVGAAIVLRIVDPAFAARPVEDQRALLACLDRLNPARAEAVAMELLATKRAVSSAASDRVRVLAAELLGARGSEDALPALKKAARGVFFNSPTVREAAKAALARLEQSLASRGGRR